jgi:hypothetical protein
VNLRELREFRESKGLSGQVSPPKTSTISWNASANPPPPGYWLTDRCFALIFHENTAAFSTSYDPLVVPGLLQTQDDAAEQLLKLVLLTEQPRPRPELPHHRVACPHDIVQMLTVRLFVIWP